MSIIINLDVMMAKRKKGLTELAGEVDITLANLSILKNNKAKAVRLSTLDAICRALNCQPGDILEYVEMYLATLIQYAGIKLHKNALNKGFRTFAVYGSLYFFAYLAVGY